MNNRRKLQHITYDFKSHLRQLIDYVNGEQKFVQINNLTYTKDKIKEITDEISDPNIVVLKYSWKENGGFGNSNDFMDTQSRQMLDRIEEYVEALINKNNTTQEMYDITVVIFDFASGFLRLYIPEEVKTMFEKLIPRITKWRSDNAALNARNNADELTKHLNYNRQIDENTKRSLARYQALERKEADMLTKRSNIQSNHGGKSMKPKQHRNSKTQKKRQRKNQKK